MPQNGVVADRHAKTLHQPFCRPTASAMAEKMNNLSDLNRSGFVGGSNS